MLFESEVEFEHGGTGVTMEFDRLEEFGEFEQEVEKGGEIVVEKLQATFQLRPAFNVRVGHLYVPVGLLTAYDEPEDYFTNTYPEAEAAVIPTIWHETGAGFFGQVGRVHYQGYVVTGLDATGFSSATWVRRGHQMRFETANAEDLALTGRVDFDVAPECRVGASAYYGNSAGNRPKPDLAVPAYVTIFDGHANADGRSVPAARPGALRRAAECRSRVGREPQPLQQPEREAHAGRERRPRMVRRRRRQRAGIPRAALRLRALRLVRHHVQGDR